MNILFVSISEMPDMDVHSVSLDLLHQLRDQGHHTCVVCAVERRDNADTYLSEESGFSVLRVKTGNNKKANLIEKGINTLLLPSLYIRAIRKHFSDIKFDLVLYPTPPITHYSTVKFVKKRDDAKSYLLLKDIFPKTPWILA